MRTIDADALKLAIVVEGQRSKRYKIGEFWELNGDEIRQVIDAQPTIETRRGKWKKTYLDHEAMGERPSIFYCSVCNQCIAYPVNYCPSCGADMRGGE